MPKRDNYSQVLDAQLQLIEWWETDVALGALASMRETVYMRMRDGEQGPRVYGPGTGRGWGATSSIDVRIGAGPAADGMQSPFITDDRPRSRSTSLREAEAIIEVEMHRLNLAPPYWVNAEMVELIQKAAETLEPTPLHRMDLFTPDGFVYFERPLRLQDVDGKTLMIQAVCWTSEGVVDGPGDDGVLGGQGVWEADLAFEGVGVGATGDRSLRPRPRGIGGVREMQTELGPDGVPRMTVEADGKPTPGIMLTTYMRMTPQQIEQAAGMYPSGGLLICDHTGWSFGREWTEGEWGAEGTYSSHVIHPSMAGLRISLLSFWRLIQQRIAAPQFRKPDRQARKRWSRSRVVTSPDYGDIRVVTLRRYTQKSVEHDRDPEADPVEWSHRWVVDGHWRNQWYPSEGVHRPIFIESYVKGPDDKPLIIKERIRNVVR